jgi:hypothetical protein
MAATATGKGLTVKLSKDAVDIALAVAVGVTVLVVMVI